jgi:hypothetical protein
MFGKRDCYEDDRQHRRVEERGEVEQDQDLQQCAQ